MRCLHASAFGLPLGCNFNHFEGVTLKMCPLRRQEGQGERAMLGRLGLKHDVTDSVCVAVVVSWLLWPHHHYSASESPPTPWMLKGWPTFTVRTVSINDDKRPGEEKKNGRRSTLTLTSTSPPWRQFALRSTGNEAHRGNTTWDVLSREKKMICLFLLLTLSTEQR